MKAIFLLSFKAGCTQCKRRFHRALHLREVHATGPSTHFRETIGLSLMTKPVLRSSCRAIYKMRARQIDLHIQIKCTSYSVPQSSELWTGESIWHLNQKNRTEIRSIWRKAVIFLNKSQIQKHKRKAQQLDYSRNKIQLLRSACRPNPLRYGCTALYFVSEFKLMQFSSSLSFPSRSCLCKHVWSSLMKAPDWLSPASLTLSCCFVLTLLSFRLSAVCYLCSSSLPLSSR